MQMGANARWFPPVPEETHLPHPQKLYNPQHHHRFKHYIPHQHPCCPPTPSYKSLLSHSTVQSPLHMRLCLSPCLPLNLAPTLPHSLPLRGKTAFTFWPHCSSQLKSESPPASPNTESPCLHCHSKILPHLTPFHTHNSVLPTKKHFMTMPRIRYSHALIQGMKLHAFDITLSKQHPLTRPRCTGDRGA